MIDFQKNKLRPGLAVFLLIAPFLLFPQEVPPLSTMLAELALSTIFGEASPASPYAERLRLIHRLPSDLSPEQLARCRAFLESPLAGQPLPDLEFNGLKNELVFALLRQREGLAQLAELLVRMSRAPETDATWRDYCVQFLGKCHSAIPDEKSRPASERPKSHYIVHNVRLKPRHFLRCLFMWWSSPLPTIAFLQGARQSCLKTHK